MEELVGSVQLMAAIFVFFVFELFWLAGPPLVFCAAFLDIAARLHLRDDALFLVPVGMLLALLPFYLLKVVQHMVNVNRVF